MPRGKRLTSDERIGRIHEELNKLSVTDQLRFARRRIQQFDAGLPDTSYMALESIDDLIRTIDADTPPTPKTDEVVVSERVIRIISGLQNGTFNLTIELNRSSMVDIMSALKDFFIKLSIDEARFDRIAASRCDDVSKALESLRSYYNWDNESEHFTEE